MINIDEVGWSKIRGEEPHSGPLKGESEREHFSFRANCVAYPFSNLEKGPGDEVIFTSPSHW
jgi:hypothetical protein